MPSTRNADVPPRLPRLSLPGLLAAVLVAGAGCNAAWGQAVAASSSAAEAAPHGFAKIERTASGILLTSASGTLAVEPWGDRIVRVRFHRSREWPGAYNPAVIGAPNPGAWDVATSPDSVVLSTTALKVRVNRSTGAIAFLDMTGTVITEAAGFDASSLPSGPNGPLQQSFALDDNDATYGLGQHQGGVLDYRGTTVRLQQANRDVAIPMLVSSGGYGILWNNASVTNVDVALPQSAGQVVFRSEYGSGIDYDFIYGPELDGVVGGYRTLTGAAPLMARWTWGLWQSKERYQSQDELLAVASKYRALDIPLDAVVQDWQYWRKGGWGSHEFDPKRYPDPAAMVRDLHANHVHAIISVWPRFDLGLANLAELDRLGAAYPVVYPGYPDGQVRWYDPFSAPGRALYWQQIMTRLGSLDFDGWWLDASEPELGGEPGQMRALTTAQGPAVQVYNAYPLWHTTAVHDGSLRDMPAKRPFILTRSAYAGQQRNAAVTWSGDTHGSWDTLRRQIPAGLNFSLSGIPYWSADIGGFFGGSPGDPNYAELFTRWYEFAVFNPMFRVHGTGEGREPWAFPQATQKILLQYDQLRYRLLPYIYALSWDVTQRAGTMMRPLAMDFRADRNTLDITDQYMFGKALMVSPVVQPATVSRTVYLPSGTDWVDFWDGSRHHGGQVLVTKADLATIPLHVRAGSILPLGPVKQYADEHSDAPIELRIYPGRDGSFELYDDEGDGPGYAQGQHATVRLSWNDTAGRIDFGPRVGSFPGMARQQAFRVVCGTQESRFASANVVYVGQPLSVALPACGQAGTGGQK